MKFGVLKSRSEMVFGFFIFLAVTSGLWLSMMTAVGFELGIKIFGYIDNHQLGFILLGLPVLVWNWIKNYRFVAIAGVIVLLLLVIKNKIF